MYAGAKRAKQTKTNKKNTQKKKEEKRILDCGLPELLDDLEVEYSQTQRMMNRQWDLNASSRTQEPLDLFCSLDGMTDEENTRR